MAPLSVLHISPHEIVVCKPPALASELPRDPHGDSLLTRLRDQGYDGLRLVHRLDAPASGVMIVARTAAAAAYYSAEIEARRWKKIYVADVALPVSRAKDLIGDHKAYLSTDARRATIVRSGGKPSFLTIAHVAPAGDANRSHVLVRLHTGRFHQIRVMLANLGAPLSGDTLYGGPDGHTIYLEQVLLGATLFGESAPTAWRATPFTGRPAWSPSLTDAIEKEAESITSA